MKKRIASILLIIILGLTVAACNRSASKAPAEIAPTEPAGEEEQAPFPVNTAPAEDAQGESPTESAVDPAPTAVSTVQAAMPTAAPTLMPVIVDTPVTPSSHVLQQGEFPYCLARRFNIDPGTLLSANGLTSNSWVSPGTTLTIPIGTTWSGVPRELMPHPTTYNVKSGDTIYSIACAFGDVFPESIAQANNLQEPYALTVGQSLQIP